MFGQRIIFIACFIFICATAVFPQESIPQNEPAGGSSEKQMGIFMDSGFGFANNLRLSDWMNTLVEGVEKDLATDYEEDKATRKEPLFYWGFDLEARFFYGNLVFGPSFGYYDLTVGHREAESSSAIYEQNIKLSFISLKASVYYKISFEGGDFLLLGGGLGYYNGTLKNEWGWYGNNGTEFVETSEDSSWTIGVHTGLEYNIRFFDSFAVSFGFVNRFAEAFTFDVNVGNNDNDDKINAGLVGVYLYTGCGYMF